LDIFNYPNFRSQIFFELYLKIKQSWNAKQTSYPSR
jgi:hypothetical protein